MSELTRQELTGLDAVIAERKSLDHELNNETNMQANFIIGNNNSGILQHEEIWGLSGGEGLTLEELTKIREHSYR